jgi:BirA family biotin operon repressor/biotin-[acetyl-CoA-carboxylase] ligase
VTTPSSAERRARVVSALRAAPRGVSGEELALDMGVSRAAVAKHVAALRAMGYEIGAEPGRGYRLLAPPDAPIPYEVAPLLGSSAWGPLLGGGVTGSTNDDARELARNGAPDGTVVLASAQTRGRGRLGRHWDSPRGGVYLSMLLRPDVAPAEAGVLPLVVGLGVARGLESLGARVGLKWPNDVWMLGAPGVSRGKVAGVLLESMIEGERLAWVVAGVGVDVRAEGAASPGAAYLELLPGGAPPLAVVAAAVLDGVAEVAERFEAGGFAAVAGEYSLRSVLTGEDVTVSDASGRPIAAGRVTGVDESGRLVLEGADGSHALSAGDVTLRV